MRTLCLIYSLLFGLLLLDKPNPQPPTDLLASTDMIDLDLINLNLIDLDIVELEPSLP